MHDPDLPAAATLLGPHATAVLAPAVEGAGGRLLAAWPTQVRYQPGRRLAVRYAADVAWPATPARRETLGALTQRGALPDTLSIVEGPNGARVGVWRYPYDPFLPGLPQVAFPAGAQRLLAHLGLPDQPVTVEPVVYRPSSRAVLRLRTVDATYYAKVLRPGAVARLRALHDAFAPHVPVAASVGWSDVQGVLVQEELEGVTLGSLLTAGGAVPPAADIAGLLAAIQHVELPAQPAPAVARVRDHVSLLAGALPQRRAEIQSLGDEAGEPDRSGEHVLHGDFYEAQLLVRDGRVSGVLDLDGARRGGRLEDAANLLGHLVALAHVRPAMADRIAAYRQQLTRVLVADGDADALRREVLGVLLGLATTSFRRQEPDWQERTIGWLELCRRWADGGARAAGVIP